MVAASFSSNDCVVVVPDAAAVVDDVVLVDGGAVVAAEVLVAAAWVPEAVVPVPLVGAGVVPLSSAEFTMVFISTVIVLGRGYLNPYSRT
jgi:hypothetical protein